MSHDRNQQTEHQLAQLWQSELARAGGFRPHAVAPRHSSRIAATGRLLVGVGLLAVAVTALYVARPTGPSTGASSAASSPLVNGIPSSIDGQRVLRGDDLRAAIASNTDDALFLAGGWMQSHVVVRACQAEPVNPTDAQQAIDMCRSFGLYDQPDGGVVIWVAPGTSGLLTADMIGVTRPVVLQLHTHDSRCQTSECAQEPVLASVAWLGNMGWVGVSLPPHPTPPATAITQDQAIAKALASVDFLPDSRIWSVNVELQSEAVPAEWPLQVDPWVWAIVAEARDGRTAMVLLDYVTGDSVESELPAP